MTNMKMLTVLLFVLCMHGFMYAWMHAFIRPQLPMVKFSEEPKIPSNIHSVLQQLSFTSGSGSKGDSQGASGPDSCSRATCRRPRHRRLSWTNDRSQLCRETRACRAQCASSTSQSPQCPDRTPDRSGRKPASWAQA